MYREVAMRISREVPMMIPGEVGMRISRTWQCEYLGTC